MWSAVESFLIDHLFQHDDATEHALRESERAALPAISVAAPEGKLLYLLARLGRARRILEIGTLGGYSTIWLARALPADGRLITLEISERHAEVARANLEHAGVADVVDVIVAPALDTLAWLKADNPDPFDMVFIDADKENSLPYFEAALGMSRAGTLIVVDNVIRRGEVANPQADNESTAGVQRLLHALKNDRRVDATALQTVGSKGYDGLLFAMVL